MGFVKGKTPFEVFISHYNMISYVMNMHIYLY